MKPLVAVSSLQFHQCLTLRTYEMVLVYVLGDNNTEEKLYHKIIIVVPVGLQKK